MGMRIVHGKRLYPDKMMTHIATDQQGTSAVLALNSGSSSLKFAAFEISESKEQSLLRGAIERIGLRSGTLKIRSEGGDTLVERHVDVVDHDAALNLLLSEIPQIAHDSSPHVIGHRIVHGGPRFVQPRIVTREIMKGLMELTRLAPDHLPHEVKAIRAIDRSYPDLVQVVCFDTAFHCLMPDVARMYPLPRFLWKEGVRKYGFHGLSYEYIMCELAREAGMEESRKRILIAHLGNGASMTAVREGRGLDTTMGLTPAGGLMMGSRPGDLDPGVILYLAEEKGLKPSSLNDMVNKQSGLLAVSGQTSDMHELLELEAKDSHAAEAIELFCYQATKCAAALVAVLGGLDTLIFTAGIGENSPPIRSRICEGLQFLGIKISQEANMEGKKIISTPDSAAVIRVMKTDEELMVARHSFELLKGRREGKTE